MEGFHRSEHDLVVLPYPGAVLELLELLLKIQCILFIDSPF